MPADDPNMDDVIDPPVGAGADAAPGEAGGVAPNTNIDDDGAGAATCSGLLPNDDPNKELTGFSAGGCAGVVVDPNMDDTGVSGGAPNKDVPEGAGAVEPKMEVPDEAAGVVDDPNIDPVADVVDDVAVPNEAVAAVPPKMEETSVFVGSAVAVPKMDDVGPGAGAADFGEAGTVLPKIDLTSDFGEGADPNIDV